MTVGGAGAGFSMYLAMVHHLLPYVESKKVALFINFGDHEDVYHKLVSKVEGIIPALESSHAVAYAMKLAETKKYELPVRNRLVRLC